MHYDIVIIGAGVIGGMLARELSKYRLSVCVLEKSNDVAMGASKANSGIVHGGFDPHPGTLKAKLNSAGVEKLFAAAKELHVPHQRNGSFVCAFNADEANTLQALFNRGIENGVPDLRLLSGDEARVLEPNLSPEVVSVLDVPTAGIICPYELTIAAIGNAMDNGVELLRNFEVVSIQSQDHLFTVTSSCGNTVTAEYLINCAGCGADRISALAGDPSFTIIPRAGEYMLLDKAEGSRVSRTIFQVPTKEGKGILVSPTVDGNLLVGPTAGEVASSEHTETSRANLDLIKKFAAKSVPPVDFRQVITSFSGVRASTADGDFIITPSSVSNFINVSAIDSPGLTSCVAIAEYTVDLLHSLGVDMVKKTNWCGEREDSHTFRNMSISEQDAHIKTYPEYGKIVCRCETVSEGEIRAAIRNNPKALDLDSVKRRTRSGMGRCQGGFCAPHVMRLISEELGIPMEQVTKKGGESTVVLKKI